MATAESVKAKLQGLITSANAKTGKSDANLTDAVNTLLEGYGQGGGGECSSKHIIEVDELPAVGEGVEGAVYQVKAFADVYVVVDGTTMFFSQEWNAKFLTATSTTMVDVVGTTFAVYYLTDIQDIFFDPEGIAANAQSLGNAIGGLPFKGEITDTANATENGYYAYMGGDLYKYTNEEYVRLFEQGGLLFTSNNDGTCYVRGIEENHAADIVIPSVAPNGDTVTKIASYAFQDTLIKSIVIPDTIETIGTRAFYNCAALKSVTFPNKRLNLFYTNETFANCFSLEKVDLGGAVDTVITRMFENCVSLTELNFAHPLYRIYGGAFDNCINLTKITFDGTMEQWGEHPPLDNNWENVPATEVTCTDGTVTL